MGGDAVRSTAAKESRRASERPRRFSNDALVLLGPAALYLIAFSLFPLIYSLRISFTDLAAAGASGAWVGLDNSARLFQDEFFWNAALNSALMVGFAVAIQLVLGTALALFFNLHLKGSWIVRGALVLPMLVTPVVVGVLWRALLNPDWGIVNWALAQIGIGPINWLGSTEWAIRTLILVDVWQWTPFVFLIVFARLQALPHEVFEAAQVDGASRFQMLRRVTLPLLVPAIAFAGIFRAIDAFRSFDLVYGLSYGGPARSTTTLSFLSFQNGFQFQEYGYAAATAYVMVIALVIATTLLLRVVRVRGADAV